MGVFVLPGLVHRSSIVQMDLYAKERRGRVYASGAPDRQLHALFVTLSRRDRSSFCSTPASKPNAAGQARLVTSAS